MGYIGKKHADSFRSLAKRYIYRRWFNTTFDITNAALQANDLWYLWIMFVKNGAGKSYTLGVDGNGLLKELLLTQHPDSSTEIYVINTFKS